jgi:hypothetical protein
VGRIARQVALPEFRFSRSQGRKAAKSVLKNYAKGTHFLDEDILKGIQTNTSRVLHFFAPWRLCVRFLCRISGHLSVALEHELHKRLRQTANPMASWEKWLFFMAIPSFIKERPVCPPQTCIQ